MTKEFDERNMAKSRRVCEDMEAAHVTKWLKLTERERAILAMRPRFEDSEPVWFGDAVEAHHGGAITIEAIEFSRGKVCVKDAEDGDWDTSMYAMRPLKRPAPEVLDADGVEIKAGDTVWHEDGSEQLVEEMNRYGVRCFDGDKRRTFDPKYLTHTRPDSWERLEDDASKDTCVYFGGTGHFDCSECSSGGVNCFRRMKLDIVRRAKALAGVEVGR